MAGEHIEDVKIGLMSMDNGQIEDKCSFLPASKSTAQIESSLSTSMDQQLAKEIINNP